jgi:hypothetical protein
MFANADPGNDTPAQATPPAVADSSARQLRRPAGINHTPRRFLQRALGAVLAVGAIGGLAAAVVPTAASAAVQSKTAAVSATNYGETPQFHCNSGQVVLDNIRIPNAELPVSWEAVVYYYGSNGTWYPYAQMYTPAPGQSAWETINTAVQNVYDQQKMYASVPHNYYYAVRVYMVPNANAGYQPHWDWASLSYGYGTGTSCVA